VFLRSRPLGQGHGNTKNAVQASRRKMAEQLDEGDGRREVSLGDLPSVATVLNDFVITQ
jgi:hypothetical protein